MRMLFLSIVFLACFHQGHAQDSEKLFDQATQAYNEGDFEAAAAHYEAILAAGKHSAAVYFNLGNAHYKMNQVGPSIYYYEKALLLDPDDQEIRNNLRFARNMTLDAFDTLEEPVVSRFLRQIPERYSADQWAVIALCCLGLFAMLFITFRYLLTPFSKRMAFIASLLFLLFAIASIFLAYQREKAYLEDRPAIIMAEVTKARSEPNTRGQEAFELHEGTKVQVVESLEGWGKVRLSNGTTGWARLEDMRMLKDF